VYLLRVVYACDRVVTYELSTFVQLKHLVAIYVICHHVKNVNTA